MSEPQRLQRDIENLQQQWQQSHALLAVLQQEYIDETRQEERLRLQRIIDQRQAEHDALEMRLQRLEAARDKAERLTEARQLERNQAYAEAVRVWEAVCALDPDDVASAQERQRVQARQQRAERLQGYLHELARRMVEIKTIFVPLTLKAKQMLEGGEEDTTLLGLIELFLDRTLTAEDLSNTVRDLEGPRPPAVAPSMNFQALAARMRRGEIVYCLGSDIPALFDTTVPDTKTMVATLAAQVQGADAQGALSMVAQDYHMKPDFGLSSFVRHLQQVLPNAPLQRLASARILRSQARQNVLWYELYHDLFSDIGVVIHWCVSILMIKIACPSHSQDAAGPRIRACPREPRPHSTREWIIAVKDIWKALRDHAKDFCIHRVAAAVIFTLALVLAGCQTRNTLLEESAGLERCYTTVAPGTLNSLTPGSQLGLPGGTRSGCQT